MAPIARASPPAAACGCCSCCSGGGRGLAWGQGLSGCLSSIRPPAARPSRPSTTSRLLLAASFCTWARARPSGKSKSRPSVPPPPHPSPDGAADGAADAWLGGVGAGAAASQACLLGKREGGCGGAPLEVPSAKQGVLQCAAGGSPLELPPAPRVHSAPRVSCPFVSVHVRSAFAPPEPFAPPLGWCTGGGAYALGNSSSRSAKSTYAYAHPSGSATFIT